MITRIFRTIFYSATIINILFQVIYMTLGKYTTTDLRELIYIFYIFRPEYIIISGIIAFFVACGILVLIIRALKNICVCDIIMLMLNLEYIVYYLGLMKRQ